MSISKYILNQIDFLTYVSVVFGDVLNLDYCFDYFDYSRMNYFLNGLRISPAPAPLTSRSGFDSNAIQMLEKDSYVQPLDLLKHPGIYHVSIDPDLNLPDLIFWTSFGSGSGILIWIKVSLIAYRLNFPYL